MAKKRPKCPPELEGTTFEEYLKFGSDAAVELAIAAADPDQEMVECTMWLSHDCPADVVHICGEDIPKFVRVPVDADVDGDRVEVNEWSREKKRKAIPVKVYERIKEKLEVPFRVHPVTGKVLTGEHAWDWKAGKLVGISKYVHIELADESADAARLDNEIVAFYETYQALLVKQSTLQRRILDKGTEIEEAEKVQLEAALDVVQTEIEGLEPPAALAKKQKMLAAAAADEARGIGAPAGFNTNK